MLFSCWVRLSRPCQSCCILTELFFSAAQAQPQCRVDSDCRDPDRCVQGSCQLACRVDQCGVNAQCDSQHHRAVCSCPPGYVGNPHIECTIGEYTRVASGRAALVLRWCYLLTVATEKSKPRFWGNPTQKPRVKKIF